MDAVLDPSAQNGVITRHVEAMFGEQLAHIVEEHIGNRVRRQFSTDSAAAILF